MASTSRNQHRLVLVGGGHSHVEVLRAWARRPMPGVHLSMVTDGPRAVYSGMVPGLVAGQYRFDEIEIDVERLARRAGAAWIEAQVTGLDASARRIRVRDAPPIDYDTASFDVGSTVAGLDLPGVAAHALPTRPIGEFARRADAVVHRARARPGLRLVVVGAGAAGVEIACAFRGRFDRLGLREASVALLERGPRVLPGYPPAAARRIEGHARARGIEIRCRAGVARAEPDRLVLEGGESVRCDALVWVAGPASLPLFDGSGLARDARGFVQVRATLQAAARDEVFAAGDCASLLTEPALPRAGVHAVRQGPVLAQNLAARVGGRPLAAYRPQRDFLSLLNLGNGRAVATKWGLAAEGAWAWRLKDAIDRRFVRRYR